MKTTNKTIPAVASLLISAIIIGFSYVVLKTGLAYASPFTILADRLTVAALVVVILKRTSVIKIDKIDTGQKAKLFFLSLLYPIAFFLFQNFGMQYITASEAAIIYSLIPIFTTVASAVVLKERTTLLQKFGIVLSFGGMAYISFQSFRGFSNNVAGYVLLFCSLLSMVLYYVFLKKNVAKVSPLTITYYLLLFAVISFVGVYLGWEFIKVGKLPELNRLENHTYILAVLYLGVLSTLVTSMLTAVGIKNLSATQTSIFSNISPFIGILSGVLIMGDVLKTYQIIGAVCILTGMFISLRYTEKN